jgi:hypothetical protein
MKGNSLQILGFTVRLLPLKARQWLVLRNRRWHTNDQSSPTILNHFLKVTQKGLSYAVHVCKSRLGTHFYYAVHDWKCGLGTNLSYAVEVWKSFFVFVSVVSVPAALSHTVC